MYSKRTLLVAATTILSLSALASSVSASSPRRGELRVQKECSTFTAQAGDICTITSSSLAGIEAGSTITYLQGGNFETLTLSTDVVIDPPGPGNNVAFGHCEVNLATGFGACSLSGGTGKFTHLSGSVDVTPLGGVDWEWFGTYSLSPRD